MDAFFWGAVGKIGAFLVSDSPGAVLALLFRPELGIIVQGSNSYKLFKTSISYYFWYDRKWHSANNNTSCYSEETG